MGKFLNGLLYIIGAAPGKTKQRSAKSIQTISLRYSSAKSTLKVLLNYNKVEKTEHENFDFVLLLPLTPGILEKYMYTVNANIKHTVPNDCFANLLHSYLFLASCELQCTSGKLWPKNCL